MGKYNKKQIKEFLDIQSNKLKNWGIEYIPEKFTVPSKQTLENKSKAKWVFVFGSNTEGIHGAGAALYAYSYLNAEFKVGEGPTGNCYAIPTKQYENYLISRNLEDIYNSIFDFIDYVQTYTHLHSFLLEKNNFDVCFYVSEIGCGLASFEVSEIAPAFYPVIERRLYNVFLPESFTKYYLNNAN